VNPEVVNPIVLGEGHARDRFLGYGDPRQGPILIPNRDWRIGPQSSVDFINYGLNKIPHRRNFGECWAANLDFSGDLIRLPADCNWISMFRDCWFA
jgi:hypothetical protein